MAVAQENHGGAIMTIYINHADQGAAKIAGAK